MCTNHFCPNFCTPQDFEWTCDDGEQRQAADRWGVVLKVTFSDFELALSLFGKSDTALTSNVHAHSSLQQFMLPHCACAVGFL